MIWIGKNESSLFLRSQRLVLESAPDLRWADQSFPWDLCWNSQERHGNKIFRTGTGNNCLAAPGRVSESKAKQRQVELDESKRQRVGAIVCIPRDLHIEGGKDIFTAKEQPKPIQGEKMEYGTSGASRSL